MCANEISNIEPFLYLNNTNFKIWYKVKNKNKIK
jgi:hypothetical protein